MSLAKISSFIKSLVDPLATVLTEKLSQRSGKSLSPSGQVVVQFVAFILLLIPILLVALMMVGMAIFSFQMLYAGI